MQTQSLPLTDDVIDETSNLASRIKIFRGRSVLVILILLAGDIISFTLAFLLATLLRAAIIPWIGGVIRWGIFIPLLELNLISILLTYALSGLYPGFGRTAVEEMKQIFVSLTLGYGVLGLAVYLQKVGPNFPRFVFIVGWFFACLFNMAIRFAIRNRASLLRWWGTPVIVAGCGEETLDVIARLHHCRRLGLKPVLILEEAPNPSKQAILGVPVIQSRQQLKQIIADVPIQNAVFIESPGVSRQEAREKLSWLTTLFPTVLVVLADSPFGSLEVKTIDLEGRLVLQTQYNLLNKKATFTKHVFDLVFGTLMAVACAPLLLLIAILIKLDSPGPILYSQERYGLHEKRFRYYKFRTMVADADKYLQHLLETDPIVAEEFHKHHKLTKDPRITRVGALLRKFSLDELPQIWHVLTGQMSLVGPRGYLVFEYEEIDPEHRLIFKIRPGLTGWWQVMGRHSTTFPQRVQLDEYYLSNWSLWLDIYVIAKTAWVIFSGKGA